MELIHFIEYKERTLKLKVVVDAEFDGNLLIDMTIQSITILDLINIEINLPEKSKIYKNIEILLVNDETFTEAIEQKNIENKLEDEMEECIQQLYWKEFED